MDFLKNGDVTTGEGEEEVDEAEAGALLKNEANVLCFFADMDVEFLTVRLSFRECSGLTNE